MNPLLKNVLALVAGWASGSMINIGLVKLGHNVKPIEGIDPNDMEAMAAVMPTLDFQYFVFPFLAHALGTLFGATVAGLLAANHKMKFSLGIGFLFLLGGIMMVYMLPGPLWFAITDLTMAYIPMAWIGGKLALQWSKGS